MATPSLIGVIDTYGIELIHPRREGRSDTQIGRKVEIPKSTEDCPESRPTYQGFLCRNASRSLVRANRRWPLTVVHQLPF